MTHQADHRPSQALVSIVTPTFNRAHLLRRTWASICEQSVQAFEWVVVDDGSTDDTATVIQSLNDARIKYIFQPNQGVNAARNRGEKDLRTPYVIFLDSDDAFCGPDALATMVREVAEAPQEVGVVYFGVVEAGTGQKMYRIKKDRLIASYEDHVCEQQFSGEFFPIYRRDALTIAPWPTEVSGLECLRHWEIARHQPSLFIDFPTRIYYTASANNLSSAASAIDRAQSMAKATQHLIKRHRATWASKCPDQIGRYTFFLAMYEALSGTGAPGKHLMQSLRWGDRNTRCKSLALLATLCLPLRWRRHLFIWRTSRA